MSDSDSDDDYFERLYAAAPGDNNDQSDDVTDGDVDGCGVDVSAVEGDYFDRLQLEGQKDSTYVLPEDSPIWSALSNSIHNKSRVRVIVSGEDISSSCVSLQEDK
mmetsp:Transcript_10514/g.15997  ORF Transcript_10514/g.15997 Transcript_10514/m.15997 type:complete len:105 (+) Transcript_10514:18-332(+)